MLYEKLNEYQSKTLYELFYDSYNPKKSGKQNLVEKYGFDDDDLQVFDGLDLEAIFKETSDAFKKVVKKHGLKWDGIPSVSLYPFFENEDGDLTISDAISLYDDLLADPDNLPKWLGCTDWLDFENEFFYKNRMSDINLYDYQRIVRDTLQGIVDDYVKTKDFREAKEVNAWKPEQLHKIKQEWQEFLKQSEKDDYYNVDNYGLISFVCDNPDGLAVASADLEKEEGTYDELLSHPQGWVMADNSLNLKPDDVAVGFSEESDSIKPQIFYPAFKANLSDEERFQISDNCF